MVDVRLKRAYEPAARGDGYRILVDRLWPRGVTKDDAALDAWAKELAPSAGLRRWFGHDPRRFREFAGRYRQELRAPGARARLDDLARRAAHGPVTIVFGARDARHSNAPVVLAEVERRLGAPGRRPSTPAAASVRRSARPAPRRHARPRRDRAR